MFRKLGLVGLAALGACGGEGGGSAPPPPPVAAPVTPTLGITLSPVSQAVTATEDNTEVAIAFEATQTGTTSDPVFVDLQYDKSLLRLVGTPTSGAGKYAVSFRTAKDLGAGAYSGNVAFRLCRDANCATVYPGSAQTFSYALKAPLNDWTALQRNAAHTGYVHATLKPSSFQKAWEYAPGFTNRVSAAATKGDALFVTRANKDGTTSVHALSSASGAEQWTASLGAIHHGSAPAVAGDQLFVATMVQSSGNNKTFALETATGKLVRGMTFASQWSFFAPPTPFGDGLHQASGYYGNVVYAWNALTGALRWESTGKSGNIWDGQTPAVDDRSVYYYSGASLDVFDRLTGARTASIADPGFAWAGYSYVGGPIIGSRGNVLAYSGSTTGGNSTQPRPIASYALAAATQAWRTGDVYATTPALAKGVLYVARNEPMGLDAVSEETGAVLWSWAPPSGQRFQGNVIASDNLVFVSTDVGVHAVSITDAAHPSVWSAPTPGEMSMSPDGKLLVALRVPGGASDKLIAYSLM